MISLEVRPQEKYYQTFYSLVFFEFPFDFIKGTQLALYRTFAVPSISKLLAETGEFTKRTQKRYDDTDLILSEILENGWDSERGRTALRRMNQIHHHYLNRISNDDMLYVLSTFIYEPIRWLEKCGWRSLTDEEKQAIFCFYCELGRRMNIKNIPDSYASFELFNREYEKECFRYTETNNAIASATRDLFLSWFLPKKLWFLGRPVLYSLMDDALLQSFGFTAPPTWLRLAVVNVVKFRSKFVVRLLPKRKKPALRTTRKNRSYPVGYTINKLGPKW